MNCRNRRRRQIQFSNINVNVNELELQLVELVTPESRMRIAAGGKYDVLYRNFNYEYPYNLIGKLILQPQIFGCVHVAQLARDRWIGT